MTPGISSFLFPRQKNVLCHVIATASCSMQNVQHVKPRCGGQPWKPSLTALCSIAMVRIADLLNGRIVGSSRSLERINMLFTRKAAVVLIVIDAVLCAILCARANLGTMKYTDLCHCTHTCKASRHQMRDWMGKLPTRAARMKCKKVDSIMTWLESMM